jgi:hypothetical protein
MHLSRVMEAALRIYGKYLNVAAIATGKHTKWQSVVDDAEKAISDRTSKNKWTNDDERVYCNQLQSVLGVIEIAWRNQAMHPGKKYDEGEAEEIYNAIRTFIRHLAMHLDEAGVFTP